MKTLPLILVLAVSWQTLLFAEVQPTEVPRPYELLEPAQRAVNHARPFGGHSRYMDAIELYARFLGNVTDSNGNPVAAEVVLGIVNQSLFDLAEDNSLDIRSFFFPSPDLHGDSSHAWVTVSESVSGRILLSGKDVRLGENRIEIHQTDDERFAYASVLLNYFDTDIDEPSAEDSHFSFMNELGGWCGAAWPHRNCLNRIE